MTVLMPSWYYDKKDLKRSPSIIDGLDSERESRYRREGARFIINVGTKMGLRYDTMATGVVYFHRYYMFHSFKTFPRYVTACCCLFLAGKVEETPKKCKDIIRTAKTFLSESQFAQFGDDPKEEVMTLERILLQTIKFDLQVDHPYGYLLRYAKSLKGDKAKLQQMVQMAWTFINDSLCTTLCLQFEPEVIAIALMYLAGKLNKFEVVDWEERSSRHMHWWDMFVEGMSIELLEDICHQVLDLYSTPMANSPVDSPPATPPTKCTRRISQPPSPIETSLSPAQPKPKEPVGLPIPRLEPGELKRKASLENKKDPSETKAARVMEGKPITTITSSPKASSSLGSDTLPSSPNTPAEKIPPIHRNSSNEPVFRTAAPPSYPPPEPTTPKAAPPPMPPTSYPVTLPPQPSATYTQSGPPYYKQEYPNVQQPPPAMYSHMQYIPPPVSTPPVPPPQIHHPPPLPPQQYPDPPPIPQYQTTNVPPPYNSQYPPPLARHQNNAPLMPTPPPSMQHPAPNLPPPPHGRMNRPPPPRMPPPEGMYGSRSDTYHEQGSHRDYRYDTDSYPARRNQDFGGGSYDTPYRHPNRPGQYGMERAPTPRRYSMEQQPHRKNERGPNPNMQHSGTATGIAPVRITGSMR